MGERFALKHYARHERLRKLRHTFIPLLIEGRDALRCDDVPGLEQVRVIEWNCRWRGVNPLQTTNKGFDLFEEMDGGNVPVLMRDTEFGLVKFALKFNGHPQARIVTLRGADTAEYAHDEDAMVVDDWLAKRGFRQAPYGAAVMA